MLGHDFLSNHCVTIDRSKDKRPGASRRQGVIVSVTEVVQLKLLSLLPCPFSRTGLLSSLGGSLSGGTTVTCNASRRRKWNRRRWVRVHSPRLVAFRRITGSAAIAFRSPGPGLDSQNEGWLDRGYSNSREKHIQIRSVPLPLSAPLPPLSTAAQLQPQTL